MDWWILAFKRFLRMYLYAAATIFLEWIIRLKFVVCNGGGSLSFSFLDVYFDT